ncbi:MAG TPA: hypothetical protein VKQ30_06075 [Ktedonobacterales bacterium]|nr:hypothetical protein [Ktedonobacterales bacterium]
MNEGVSGFPAVRWGLGFGIILVIVSAFPVIWLATNGYRLPLDESHSRYLFNQLGANIAYILLSLVVVVLLCYFLAGFFTARDTGTVRSGAVAAAVAYISYAMASYLISSVVLKLSASDFIKQLSVASPALKASFAFGYVLGAMCSLVVVTLFAAGIGALGALLGCAIYGRASYS